MDYNLDKGFTQFRKEDFHLELICISKPNYFSKFTNKEY